MRTVPFTLLLVAVVGCAQGSDPVVALLSPLDDAVTALEAHVATLEGGAPRAEIESSWDGTREAIAVAFSVLDTEALNGEVDDPDAVTDAIIAIGLAVDRFAAIDDAIEADGTDDEVASPFTEGRAQTIEARQLLERLHP